MIRYAKPALSLLILLAGGSALAQGKPKEPPSNEAMTPANLTITMEDGKPVCAPAELRLPAGANVELRIESTATKPVVLTMEGGQFENSQVLHHSGDLGHVMSEKGFTVKQNGKAMIRLRTVAAGEYAYACTSTGNMSEPFRGKAILGAPG